MRIKRDYLPKELTVKAVGIDAEITGFHPDIIILDDIINYDNTSTEHKRKETLRKFLALEPILKVDGDINILGTRYHPDDLYNYIINGDRINGVEPYLAKENIHTESVFIDDDETKGVIFPEKFSEEVVQVKKERLGKMFDYQYRNNPVPVGDDQLIKDNYIKYYELDGTNYEHSNDINCILKDSSDKVLHVLTRGDLEIIISSDPAWGTGSKGDEAVICVMGKSKKEGTSGRLFVLEIVGFRNLTPKEFGRKILEFSFKWRDKNGSPARVGIESEFAQKVMFHDVLKELNEELGVYASIEELKTDKKDKRARLESVLRVFENGSIFFDITQKSAVEQLKSFTGTRRDKNDDYVDAIVYAIKMLMIRQDGEMSDDFFEKSNYKGNINLDTGDSFVHNTGEYVSGSISNIEF
jgi:predicted phage terminase large subunit-like protein